MFLWGSKYNSIPIVLENSRNGKRKLILAISGVVRFDSKRLTGDVTMNTLRIAAVVLMVSGVFGLIYGSFSYTKETEEVRFGPVELSIKEKKTINIPVWAGVGAIVIGGGLLLYGSRKS